MDDGKERTPGDTRPGADGRPRGTWSPPTAPASTSWPVPPRSTSLPSSTAATQATERPVWLVVAGVIAATAVLAVIVTLATRRDPSSLEPQAAPAPSATTVRATVAPVASNPSTVASRCAGEAGARSVSAATSIEVTFANRSSQRVVVWWIDYDGRRVRYASLGPGDSYVQPTFATHPWVVTTGEGTCLRFAVADPALRSITIDG